ncbi:hypothetical protein [Shinella pollutisoli]|uniref:Uncharacterized protein n=1 Tax=Shinella pollutisoli TaxID=2250594 RepID=A0ABV7DHW4_9HYPH|nr:hypothetical protein [Shinella pollutisoli]
MAKPSPFAIDFDSVFDVHISSAARILERGMAASLDGLACGIGPLGYKLFIASSDAKDRPDATFIIPFPRGITVGALVATLLGDGKDAIQLLGAARISANAGDDSVLSTTRSVTDKLTKALVEKVSATERAVRQEKCAKLGRKR